MAPVTRGPWQGSTRACCWPSAAKMAAGRDSPGLDLRNTLRSFQREMIRQFRFCRSICCLVATWEISSTTLNTCPGTSLCIFRPVDVTLGLRGKSPYRLVVRTSRCGRDNPGSTPGEDILSTRHPNVILALACSPVPQGFPKAVEGNLCL